MTTTLPVHTRFWLWRVLWPRRLWRKLVVIVIAAAALGYLFGWPGWARHQIEGALGSSQPAAAAAISANVGGKLIGIDKAAGDTNVSNHQLYKFVGQMANHGVRNIQIMVEWRSFEPTQGKFAGYYPTLRLFKQIALWDHNHPGQPREQGVAQLAFAPAWATSDPSQGCMGTTICAPSAGHTGDYADAALHLVNMAHAVGTPVLFWVGFQSNVHQWFPADPGVFEGMFNDTANKLSGTGAPVEIGPLAPSATDPPQGLYSPDDYVGALIKAGLDKSLVDGVVIGPTDHDSGFQAELIGKRLPGVPISVVFHPQNVSQLASQVSHWRENNDFRRGSVGAYFGDYRNPLGISASEVRRALRSR